MGTKPERRYRVICPERTGVTVTLDTARRQLDSIERVAATGHAAACRLDHVIERRDDATDTWHVAVEWLAPLILDAHLQEPVRTFDGELILASGGWSKEAADRADAAAEEGSDAWFAVLGRREHALLTGDGMAGGAETWCTCTPQPPADQWVRYERWTAQGRATHGYLCPRLSCRGIVQTG